ncbi:iron chelate uptake ABC transporter family permease subunit [Nocardioides sp. S-58]|uniref:Iron chelate uptake ABC transporter family permease subunit n=2 Tax=Nocardioides renjunii TaxID=3095075 RepID=A0ABU5K936_9ACTN|nr:iron chelate uptake ABC transporter family permease subunit [Nocardioides sp. S-58]MDZ5660970.1 iron chelate uptake ABC transporter family permease subunit [Nocardioides sp. S-58]
MGRLGTLALGLVVLGVAMAMSLGVGAVPVPVPQVLEVVGRRMHLGDFDVALFHDQIVWQLRMPRVLGAAAVGAALALCGAVLQSLTRNDLADPYLLGISGGAAVGAVTVIVLGVPFAGLVGSAAVAGAGFAGALAALLAVLLLAAGRSGSLPPTRTILAGVAVGQVCAAYTAFLVIVSGDSQAARRVLSWTLGSVAGLRWESSVFLAVVALVATVGIVALADQLDAFAFGEVSARSLGVDVTRLRWLLLVGTALVTACLVAYAGLIGFVGLVVPHMVRLVTGPGHRLLLPMCAVVGAITLVLADTVARSVVQGQEVPLGVVTGVVGAPFFAWLLRRGRHHA